MIVETKQSSPESLYKLLIGSVLPRPIAWVSTLSKDGKENLAPFSFFTVASANPPVLCFAPAYKKTVIDRQVHGTPKDTLRNIAETEEFVVNIVSHNFAKQMNETSGDYPFGVSEFVAAGLTTAPSKLVRPPRVAESLINMECKLHKLIEFGNQPGSGTLVLGDILCIHLDDSVYKDGHVDLDVLQPIGRLGGSLYCTVKDRFEMIRPKI